MKLRQSLLFLTLLGAVVCPAQVGGGSVYSGGNAGQFESEFRTLRNESKGEGQYVDATVLLNARPDAYIAVFAASESGPTTWAASQAVDAKVARFQELARTQGNSAESMYVDFVTSSRVNGFEVTERENRERFQGFRVQKTVSLTFRRLSLMESLVQAAQAADLELATVQAQVTDAEPVRNQLFAEAAQVIKRKLKRYEDQFQIKKRVTAVVVDRMAATFPIDRYATYNATDEADSTQTDGTKRTVYLPRLRAFYYKPVDAALFDAVIHPLEAEPSVQFGLYLRVKVS